MITPLPPKIGFGFTSDQKLDIQGYDYKNVGIYHNYHVNVDNWKFPHNFSPPSNLIIDGFSPNLNKQLHIGHLKNLAVASALTEIVEAKPVAMLGASLGINDGAMEALETWFDLARYKPKIYFDIELPEPKIETKDKDGCKVWTGPLGDVIVKKSNGDSTYAYHDLAFKEHVSPTHYITGSEQRSHFASLGLADKHIPLGLVLGKDGKKLKSRDGEAFSAEDALNSVIEKLNPTDHPKLLAWNIICWNFNSSSMSKDIKFLPEQWINPDSPGMFISYTYARLKTALDKVDFEVDLSEINELKHAQLAGFAGYHKYWFQVAADKMEPCKLAHFSFDLAKMLSQAYEQERIVGGKKSFVAAVKFATEVLGECMCKLRMYELPRI